MKKILGIINSFILGTQSKIFKVGQTDIYGPPPDPGNGRTISSEPLAPLYGPPQEPSVSTFIESHLFSVLASILLFIIGLAVVLNKNIRKRVKVITVTILSFAIIVLLLLARFVF